MKEEIFYGDAFYRRVYVHGRSDWDGKLPLPRLPAGTGSAFAAAILVPTSTVNITGEVKYYEVTGDSGAIVRRGFCPNCGARLFGNPVVSPDITDIMAGSLDDPTWLRPKQTFTQLARSHGTI
jgi:hypothetical protein